MSTPARTDVSRRGDGEHRRAANRAIGVSALVLLVTGGVELLLATLSHSVGLLGDAIHNLSDVSTSAVVFLGFFISKRPRTERCPYGYERTEDIAGLGVRAGHLGQRRVRKGGELPQARVAQPDDAPRLGHVRGLPRHHGQPDRHLVQARRRAADPFVHAPGGRQALLARRRLLGRGPDRPGGGRPRVPAGDPIAGFAITAFIAHVGYEVARDVLHHLMDGVEPEHIHEACPVAEAAGHVEVPVVRGRSTGRALHFELQPELPSGMTLAQARSVSERMENAVLGAIERASTVTVVPHTSLRA